MLRGTSIVPLEVCHNAFAYVHRVQLRDVSVSGVFAGRSVCVCVVSAASLSVVLLYFAPVRVSSFADFVETLLPMVPSTTQLLSAASLAQPAAVLAPSPSPVLSTSLPQVMEGASCCM